MIRFYPLGSNLKLDTSYGHDLKSNSFRQIYCVSATETILPVTPLRPMILEYVYSWVSGIIWPFKKGIFIY